MAVKWTLENRAGNPGIGPGDMFFCNDPWVGGGLHQNDASIFAPLFYDGELFAWTGAVCHQVDLGGVSPGSWSVEGRDVFWESTPVPPVKMVEAGTLRADIEDVYLRRSRVPKLIALDLRAKIGANNVAQDRLRQAYRQVRPDRGQGGHAAHDERLAGPAARQAHARCPTAPGTRSATRTAPAPATGRSTRSYAA